MTAEVRRFTMTGEHGPELVRLPTGARVAPPLPKWFDVPATGQTWEYGANPLPGHRSHMPMFLEPPDFDEDDEDRDFDCE